MSRLRRQGNMPSSQSSQHVPYPLPDQQPHVHPSSSSISLGFPETRGALGHTPQIRSSRTWTSSSGDAGQPFPGAVEKEEDRTYYVKEYNRLAKKHGLRLLVVDEITPGALHSRTGEKRRWFTRMLRSTSRELPPLPEAPKPPPLTRNKRSISDLAYHLVTARSEAPKVIDLQSMVRLTGKSILYLPPEFGPTSLVLPTCLRATAQHLVQHAATRGIFRIPGSSRAVNTLFDYYCFTGTLDPEVASTVRCVNLPSHIQSSVHDVASTFKRFLSVIPGGILGSLTTFDALVAIHSQLQGDPEFPRTKQTKLRSRLIALIINATPTQLQRNVICAVFGLLSMIGRIAENAPREDDRGHPLPTSDLMGYRALAIVFGPLLVGDLLDRYTMKLATPSAGLMLFPLSPRKIRNRHKPKPLPDGIKGAMIPTVNKILVANDIVQMIILNWRDIVRQLRSLENNHGPYPAIPSQDPSPHDTIPRSQSNPQQQNVTTHTQPPRQCADRVSDPVHGASLKRSKSRQTAGSSRRELSARPLRRGASMGALSPTMEEGDTSTDRPSKCFVGDVTEIEWHQLQEIGSKDHARNREHITPRRRNQWRTTSTLDRERVASSNVPPRTSSKRDLSATRPDSPGGGSPSPRGRCRTRGNTPSTQRRTRSERSQSRSVSSSRQVKRPKRTESNHRESRELYGDNICSRQEQIHSIEDGPRIIDSDAPMQSQQQDSKTPREPLAEDDRPPLSPVQNEERARSSRIPKLVAGAVKTPSSTIELEQVSSPMQVPPELVRNAPVPEANLAQSRPEGWNFLSKPARNGRIKSLSESPKTVSKTPDKTPPVQRSFKLITPTAKSQHTPGHDLKRGEHGSAGKSLPMKTKLRLSISESQSNTSLTDPVTQPSGVRAMAAKFDVTESPEAAPGSKRESTPKLSLQGPTGSDSKINALRNSKSGPLSTNQKGQREVWGNSSVPPKDNQSDTKEQHDELSRQSVAQRAAAIMKAESVSSSPPVTNKDPTSVSRLPMPLSHDTNAGDAKTDAKQPPSLGTWTPHQEEPPIAQYINFSRPSSSISVAPNDDSQMAPEGTAVTPTPRPGGASGLHHQIRALQKQLDSKTEEAAQLRRQLDVQGTSEIGTLSEQLREAKREARMWKDRAEAAERRVRVFERFTARLKGIREAATVADEHQANVPEGVDDISGGDTEEGTSSGGSGSSEQPPEIPQERGRDKGSGSESSGMTEDAGVVTARIRKCLHSERRSKEETREPEAPTRDELFGGDGATSEVGSRRVTSVSIEEAWMAAKGFLDEGARPFDKSPDISIRG